MQIFGEAVSHGRPDVFSGAMPWLSRFKLSSTRQRLCVEGRQTGGLKRSSQTTRSRCKQFEHSHLGDQWLAAVVVSIEGFGIADHDTLAEV